MKNVIFICGLFSMFFLCGCEDHKIRMFEDVEVLGEEFFEFNLPRSEYSRDLDFGIHAVRVKRHNIAGPALSEIIKEDPENVYANYYYGFNAFSCDNYENAIPYFLFVSKVKGHKRLREQADLLLVLAYLKSEKWKETRSQLEVIIADKSHEYYPKAVELREKIKGR